MADQITIGLNRPVSEPKFKDLLDQFKTTILATMNCHAIATVQEFNPTNQTIKATINYQKTYFETDIKGIYKPVLVDYPVLVDVPCVVSGGGLGGITFPIAQGDECLILFNDRNLSNWFVSGQVVPVQDGRLHSFSDGLAIIGLHNEKRSVQNYDMTRAVLYYGDTVIGAGQDKILLKNAITTLNTLLQDLITEIKNISTTNAVVGVPCLISATSQTALANVATQIAGLLE